MVKKEAEGATRGDGPVGKAPVAPQLSRSNPTSRRPAHPKHELTDGVRDENVTSPQSHHDARPQRRGRDFAPSYYLAKARKVWEVYLARRLLPFGSALPPLDRRRLPLTPVAAPLFHFPPNISVTN